MPTGYTDMIDRNPKITTTQWVMQGLARAFGICVTLRDDSMDLTEHEITQRLTEDTKHEVKYHEKELDKARKESLRLANRTCKAWQTAWSKYESEMRLHNQESTTEKSKNAERHNQVRDDLERILGSDKIHETTRNIVQFGIDQLKLVQSDCIPYIEAPMELKTFISDAIKSNKRDIEYHTEELAKAKERTLERINLYKRLKEDIGFLEGSS